MWSSYGSKCDFCKSRATHAFRHGAASNGVQSVCSIHAKGRFGFEPALVQSGDTVSWAHLSFSKSYKEKIHKTHKRWKDRTSFLLCLSKIIRDITIGEARDLLVATPTKETWMAVGHLISHNWSTHQNVKFFRHFVKAELERRRHVAYREQRASMQRICAATWCD